MNIKEYISNIGMNVSVDYPEILDLEIVAVEPATAEFQDQGIFSIIQAPAGNFLHLEFDEKASNDWQERIKSCLLAGCSRKEADRRCGTRPLRSLKIVKA